MSVAVPAEERRRRAPGLGLLREIARRPSGLFGLVVVAVLFIMVVFAPLVAPQSPSDQDIVNRLQGPSADHLLGTDELGRDLLSRVIFGTRVALGVAFPGVVGALLIGLVIGTIAGYVGGKVDTVLLTLMDTLQAFPAVILALVLVSVLGASLRNVILVIVVSFTPGYARVARALVLQTKENPYIEAERSLGAGGLRILTVHILPNIVAPLFILLAMDLPTAITVEAGLSFLGAGVQPPTPSWGVILADGFSRVRDTPWPVISAGGALMITTLGFTLLGETLRDIIDPRVAGLKRWRRAV
ncbi:MAG: peptide/nickel transport system permease protein [Gaiellales bacterium]|jgi:peptide/nickel transport system permease protein|nr:peptide/nickel transport system permease protein [Gaiellales bacterium]MDX6591855.1 peptide/nickel transport system permease protein [Gaiellales bacterium]